MQETRFWEYIDLIHHEETEGLSIREKEFYQVYLIKRKLLGQNFDETLAFHHIFSKKIRELFLPTLAEVFMVSWNSYEKLKTGDVYISVDGFRDFRSWIVGQGKDEFEKFKAYSNEEDFLKYDLSPDNAYREDLEYIMTDIYGVFKKLAQGQNQLVDIYEHSYLFGYDGDYQLDLNDKIDWANINKKYPKILNNR